MSQRRTPIVPGELYHVFNRSVAREPIFITKRDYYRALEVIEYYLYGKSELRFSFYNRLAVEQKQIFLTHLKTKQRIIDILAYCLMPNHMHFVIKELEPRGIVWFMSNIQNSYAKYFNVKHHRTGALFQAMFKCVRVETDEQLLHVVRYGHLNPLTSYVVKGVDELESYPWSSYQDYIGKRKSDIVSTALVLGQFSSVERFRQFTLDQANYQRELWKMEHLILE